MLDFESIDVGSPIEGLSIPALTRVTLARFAGAADDYNPMQLDDKVASAAGKSSVFASTNLVMAYVGRMVQGWAAGGSLRRFNLKVVRLVWPGDVLTCRGVVNDKREEGGSAVVEVNVWADNQRGENVANGVVVAVAPRDAKKGLTPKEREIGLVYKLAGPMSPPKPSSAPAKKTAKAAKRR